MPKLGMLSIKGYALVRLKHSVMTYSEQNFDLFYN